MEKLFNGLTINALVPMQKIIQKLGGIKNFSWNVLRICFARFSLPVIQERNASNRVEIRHKSHFLVAQTQLGSFCRYSSHIYEKYLTRLFFLKTIVIQ